MLKKLATLFPNYTFISLQDLLKIVPGHLSVWVVKGKPYSKVLLAKTISIRLKSILRIKRVGTEVVLVSRHYLLIIMYMIRLKFVNTY